MSPNSPQSDKFKKDSKRHLMTLKAQARIGFFTGIFFILEVIFLFYVNHTIPHNITRILGIIILLLTFFFLIYLKTRCKLESGDELSQQLMGKALSYSAYAQIIFVFIVGLVLSAIEKAYDLKVLISSTHIKGLALLMLGIHIVVKYGSYLLLDRLPSGYEEED
ncbi:MAG: hypothetical protein E7275_12665 [Pseudobutyrivibrio sp.]|jgi:hypothetical protein|nr:hypothetical protein [Pseudobutyrivibrio sp.]MBE5905119.1 hypothetical protein [Pseudobutyrivibrio sp.]